jgi:PAS domain S-box-containing protein
MSDPSAELEAARLSAVREYVIVDTPPEAMFDRIATIAARICDTPIAMVTFIDDDHQSIKARVGIDLVSTRRDESFCTKVLDRTTPMVVEDAREDPRFVAIPLVTQAPNVRFYAGAPIRTESGLGMGAVCVLDIKPRHLQPFQLAALEALADDVSARLEVRRVTLAVAQSDRFHRELFGANPQPMLLFDLATGRFLDANHSATAIYGWSREEFLAMPVSALWLPEDRAVKTERFAAGLPDRAAPEITRHQRKDGSVVVVEADARPFPAAGPQAMLALITDVTLREAAAGEILDANAKFVAAQRLAKLGSWETDVETGQLAGSDEMYRLFGAAPHTLSDTSHFRHAVHPDDRRRVVACHRAAMQAGTPMSVEHRIVRPDGTVRWIHTQGHMEVAGLTGRRRFVGTVQDITERHDAEARLREQAALIDSARDGIMVRDLNHVILAWNGGAERIFGWTASEAIGQDGVALLHRDAEAFQRATAKLMATGHWAGELRKATKTGEEVVVDGSWTLLRHEDGSPKSVLIINTDVTEKRKLEAQYLRAQRMESIGTLAGGIAHDLNNMLAPILMSIELLRLSIPDANAAGLLDTIHASARRGADLVKQVLTFARGVEGQREELTVVDAIRDVAKLARDTFPRGIEIVAAPGSDLWWVTGDRTQIHQVLLNLVVNARDAMPNGGHLEITATNVALDDQYAAMTPEARAANYVVIQVADTGAGMPAGVRERIFEPFFTTKGVGEGTGLGLATVQAIVRSHSGFVTVYSEVGIGTTFKVYLPALDEHRSRSTADGGELLPRGHGETVLVVDDEAAIRDISRQTLEAFGYSVMTATDGADALAIFVREGSAINAIITDIMMPIMDGPALIQAVRRLNPGVPIIAASGLTANRTGPMFGIRHFLPKPYTADAMLRALRDVLQGDR